jgi:hypothetical protein
MSARKTYSGRITALFVLLSLVAAAAGGALVLVMRAPAAPASQPTPDRTEYAGEWTPSASADRARLREIADFVARRYLTPGSTTRLADMTLRTPEIGNEPMASLAVVHPASGQAEQFSARESAVFSLCGEHADCSLSRSDALSGLLAQRAALETALRSFRAVEDLRLVAVKLPAQMPALGRLIVYFRRYDLERPLERPLRATLPLNPPPTTEYANAVEKKALATLVVNYAFNTKTTESQKARAFVLVPASEVPTSPEPGQAAG